MPTVHNVIVDVAFRLQVYQLGLHPATHALEAKLVCLLLVYFDGVLHVYVELPLPQEDLLSIKLVHVLRAQID